MRVALTAGLPDISFMIIDQKIAIIGGTAGIGLAVAKQAANAGAEVIVGSSNPERIESALEQIRGKVKGLVIDARDSDSVRRFFEQAGELDHVVATLGVSFNPAPVAELQRSAAQELYDVKYWGQVLIAQSAARHLSSNGSITLTSGVLSRKPSPGFGALSAINAAIEALARTLALELAPRRVNVVCPGFIDTGKLHLELSPELREQKLLETKGEKLPTHRVGRPEDAAQAYLYAIQSPYLTGQTLVVDGGLSII